MILGSADALPTLHQHFTNTPKTTKDPTMILLLAFLLISINPGDSPEQPNGQVLIACPETTWSSWSEIPPCDLDGSQTWILTDELSDLGDPISDLRIRCQSWGGVFALEPYDPATAFCIDLDY